MLSMADYHVSGGQETLYHYQSWKYDGLGQMTGYAQWNGSRIPTEEELLASRIQYAYDADGNVTSVTYPKEENGVKALQFTYDGNGWLTDIHVMKDNGTKNLLRSYSYTADGKIARIRDYRKFQSGSTADYILRSYTYDIHDRVTKIAITDSRNPDTEKEAYTYT